MIIKWARAISTISCLALGTLAVGCGERDGAEAAGEETVVSALSGQSPVAYQSSDHFLKVDIDKNKAPDSSVAMASGTVPSQVKLPDGSIEIGFQRNDGHWVVDHYIPSPGGGHNLVATNGLIRGGTSPSLALSPFFNSSWAFAFQGTDAHLYVGERGNPNGGTVSAAILAGGTSPSLAMKKGGVLALAWQAPDGRMWVSLNNVGAGQNTNAVLAGGTSPAIAVGGMNDTVGIAFQGVQGNLWVGSSPFQCHDKGYAVRGGTSPTVAVSGDGNRTFVAYHATADDRLHVYRYDITNPMLPQESDSPIALGMASGATPRIMAVSSRGYQVSAKDANGNLWIVLNTTGDIGGDQVEDSQLPMN